MWRCRPTAPASERGISLLELILTISLFGLLMGTVYETVITGLRVVNAANDRESVRLQLAKAMDLLTRETMAAYNVDYAQSQRFQIDTRVVDGNGDGQADNLTNINYQVVSGDLQREGVTLVGDLTALTFTYLDSNGNSTSSANSVRVMQITMTAARNGETMSLASATRLRNL